MLTKLLKFKTASSLGGGQDLLLLEDVDQQGVVVPSDEHVLKDKVARVLVTMHYIISFHVMMKLRFFLLFQFPFFNQQWSFQIKFSNHFKCSLLKSG